MPLGCRPASWWARPEPTTLRQPGGMCIADQMRSAAKVAFDGGRCIVVLDACFEEALGRAGGRLFLAAFLFSNLWPAVGILVGPLVTHNPN